MSVARRLAAALAVVGAGVLAYAVPASATGDHEEGGGGYCVDGTDRSNLGHHVDAESGRAVVWAEGRLCEPVDVILSIYKVPDSWNGNGFPADGTAVPQTLIASAKGTVGKHGRLELEVPVPDCGNVQIDLYYPPEITAVTAAGHGDQFIEGYIWSIGGPNGHPKECEPTPTPTPTDTETPTPTPTDTETPTPTPTETETPSPTPTESSPTPPAPSPTEGQGGPVPVLPPQAPHTPPVLAETGSNSTVPLLGLGILLLTAGIGLSLVGRRRTA